MASSASVSQGTQVFIGTGTGSAKTITAIALGVQTIFTSAAHGFNKGDVVTLASIGGTTVLNGLSLVVTGVTTNTFSVAYDTTSASTYTSGGTATPNVWTQIKNVKTFTAMDGSTAEIDVSNLDSTAKEFRAALRDEGQISFEVDLDDTDPGQSALLAKLQTVPAPLTNFKITLTTGKTLTCLAIPKKRAISGAVDQIVKSAVDLKISGPVTLA